MPVAQMDRVTFIIDGFNVYHSLCDAERDLKGRSTKWLNLRSLCQGYLHLFGRSAVLEEIFYFSALAKHLEATHPDVTKRHRDYLSCLEHEDVKIVLNRFKKKTLRCPSCSESFKRFEEKETDVAIATQLLELLVTDACDTVVLVTGDTDLAPVFRTAERLFPHKKTVFAFPYRRKNKELAQLARGSFEIGKEQYAKHQFPNHVVSGTISVTKPSSW